MIGSWDKYLGELKRHQMPEYKDPEELNKVENS